MQTRFLLTLGALAASTTLTLAQSGHGGMDHRAHDAAPAAATLSEPGQGAFAALSEVVRLLEADPTTDWSRVDLTGLRAHLLDMDRLITAAQVTETALPDGLSSLATGDAETLATLRRMLPAHAAQLSQETRWTVTTEDTDDGMILRVISADPAVVARIQGLGFFGLMASQDHHRAHHLSIARGETAHGH
ncbi:hypothetical protein [Marinovum sp.]|uniref:hypothetical protein n=1 Tax=Marinovum sp. TaxID=2024839 RepID=UPI003A92E7D7